MVMLIQRSIYPFHIQVVACVLNQGTQLSENYKLKKKLFKKNSFKRINYFQVEHARWFSKCAFVRQNKGQGFIDQVLQRAAELVS